MSAGTSATSRKTARGHEYDVTGLAAVATSGSYTDLTSKPTIPALPISESDVTNLTTDLAAKAAYGFAFVNNAPSTSQTVPAGYSLYVPVSYEIAAGTSLEIAANACMEIG